ncbi:hypothetical protein [Sphingomonas sp. PB1R3]|uniref:hypothetical protein n=1 Tax=Sphingomonas flavida TaxID=3096154 RepID=UPI002FC91AB6
MSGSDRALSRAALRQLRDNLYVGTRRRIYHLSIDGAILSMEWMAAVWDGYVTGAQRPGAPSDQQYGVKRFHYESRDEMRTHLANFMTPYDYAYAAKASSGFMPYGCIAKIRMSEPDRFIVDAIHQMPRLYTSQHARRKCISETE